MTRIDYRDCHTSDDAAEGYRDVYASGYYAAQWRFLEQPLLRKLFEQQRDRGAARMLDIACGQGRITLLGGEYFPEVLGVDYSSQMLARAKENQAAIGEKVSQVRFEVGDVSAFTAEKPFDLVTAFRFFLNAEDELRHEGLRCVRRNLAPNGVFITNVHTAATSPLACYYGVSNSLRRLAGKRVSAVRNSISLRQFRKMLSSEGLRIDSVERYSLLPRIGSATDSLAERYLGTVERVGGFIPGLRTLSQSFLVCARPL